MPQQSQKNKTKTPNGKEKGVKFLDNADGEFDVIESDASVASTDESDTEEPIKETLKYLNEEVQKRKAESQEKNIQERIKTIKETKVGVKEFIQILDPGLLKLFFGSLAGYYIVGFILCILYLVFVYFFNDSLWHEYFPVEDQSEAFLEDKVEL